MINLLRHIANLETRRTADAVIAFSLRCWQAYRFLEPTQDMRAFLQRANHAATAAHRRNSVHLNLYALTIFIAIEAGNFDNANAMLDKAMSYRNFLRVQEPYFYGVLCFLYAYLELNQGRARSAKKYRSRLEEHVRATRRETDFLVFQGLLSLAADEFSDAEKFFSDAFDAGSWSVFLFEGLYRLYKLAPEGVEIILPVLTYAAQRGADISAVAVKHNDAVSRAAMADHAAAEELYAASGYPPLLKDICAARIACGDMSAEAFAFYLDAEKRQVYTPGIFDALIRAAHENSAQRLNRYTLKNFLATAQISDPALAVYVYHFLITDPALAELLLDAQNKILQFGTLCLEKNFRGREANSVYLYLRNRFRALGITGAPLNKAEEILRENLTLFELRLRKNSAAKFIYVTEPEKRGTDVYEVGDTDSIIIEAVGNAAACTCLGAGRRAVLNEKVIISPMIANADPALYFYFFQKGDRRFHLLAFLTNCFLTADEPPAEAAPVYEAILAETRITKMYRMRILAALGRIYHNAGNLARALECYGEVDENAIAGDLQVLNVYLQTGEYARAARLISAKHKTIPHESLFAALTVIISEAHDEKENLATVCYDLLLKNFFDENILAFVLENFRASYGEWAALAQVIDEDNHSAPLLDARVLQSALFMSRFDPHAQKAFVRFFKNSEAVDECHSATHFDTAELIANFAEFTTFRMLADEISPDYDLLTILEKIYFSAEFYADKELLSIALAGVFIRKKITTLKSAEIIADALASLENAGILLPVFKENPQTPFAHKFQPFLYKGLPEKNCRLYYRIDDDANFLSVPMQYLKYGLYAAAVPMFFGETFTYYFSEESESGSVATKEQTVRNETPFLCETEDDTYFLINNAIVSERNFKHDHAEKIISRLVKDIRPVRAHLM